MQSLLSMIVAPVGSGEAGFSILLLKLQENTLWQKGKSNLTDIIWRHEHAVKYMVWTHGLKLANRKLKWSYTHSQGWRGVWLRRAGERWRWRRFRGREPSSQLLRRLWRWDKRWFMFMTWFSSKDLPVRFDVDKVKFCLSKRVVSAVINMLWYMSW